MVNQQATEAAIGWLAGIIDGEGYLGMSLETEHWYRAEHNTRQKSIRVELRVTNTDPTIIEKVAEILREIGVNPYLRGMTGGRMTTSHRPVYEASIKRMAPTQRVLGILRDHLTGSKQERADLILRFIALRQNNPGEPNPAYANDRKGNWGPRTIRPYSVEELEIGERCRALQSGKGASETAREIQARFVAKWKAAAALRRQPEKIQSSFLGNQEE